MNIKLLSFITLVLCMSSCTKVFYQVVSTKPVNPHAFTQTEGQYVYEDENCRITYNMWDRNGTKAYVFANKTDRNMYIDLAKSCALTNEYAYNTEGNDKVSGYSALRIIPPHTSRLLSPFIITDSITKVMGLKEKIKHSESVSFTQENTPLTFGNYITYCFDNHENETTITHMFYVNRVTNIPRKEFGEYVSINKIYNGQQLTFKKAAFAPLPSIYQKTGFYLIYTY